MEWYRGHMTIVAKMLTHTHSNYTDVVDFCTHPQLHGPVLRSQFGSSRLVLYLILCCVLANGVRRHSNISCIWTSYFSKWT